MFQKIKIFLRWCFFLTALTTLVAAGIAYRRADAEIRRVVGAELQKKFPNLDVSFESVRLDSTRGVRIRSIAWRRRDASADDPPLLATEEIYVECLIDWNSFVDGKFAPQKIVVARPQLRTRSDADAFADDLRILQPIPDETPCPIEIYDASIVFSDAPDNDPEREVDATTFAGFRLTLTPTPRSSFGELPKIGDETLVQSSNPPISADPNNPPIFTNASKSPQLSELDKSNNANLSADSSRDVVWVFELTGANPYVETLDVRGFATSNDWAAQGSAHKLDVAPILARFSEQIDGNFTFLRQMQGQTSFDFELRKDENAANGARFRVDGEFVRGAVVLPILKYPLSDVEIRYSISENSASLEKLTARSGSTTLTAGYRQNGPFAAPTQAAARIRLDDFPLDDEQLKKLARENAQSAGVDAPKIRSFLNFLDDYRFSATSNVDLTLEKSEKTENSWAPTSLVVDGRDVDLVCSAFPYRLERLAGRVSLDRTGTLTLALSSEFNEKSLKIDGKFENALGTPRGGVVVEGLGYPIDAKLLSALPESSRAEIARLRPSGTIDVDFRLNYEPELADPLRLKTTIGVRDASIRYDVFPLPISSIGGLIKMEDGAWVFSNLSGKSGAARLRASGSLVSGKAFANAANGAETNEHARGAEFAEPLETSSASRSLLATIPAPSGAPLPLDAWRFEMTTDVEEFPLGEELQSALAQYENLETLEKIRLRGKADGQIRLAFRTDSRKFDLEFDAVPIPGSASMKPDDFPYELTDLEGRVAYRAGELTIADWRGRNGRTVYSANVGCRFSPQNGWIFDLSSLRIDEFQLDRDLQSAAPPATLAFVDFFQPVGFFNVDGALRVSRGVGPNAPLRAVWDVRVVAQQNAARPGVSLENICGRVKIRGALVENGPLLLCGEFDLDSFCCGDLQISQFSGPFYYDGTDFFWGREAPPPQRSPLYRDPFLKERFDADPLYQVASSAAFYRAQEPDAAPGFAAPQAVSSDVSSDVSSTPSSTTRLRPIQARIFEGQATSDGIFYNREIPTYRFAFNLQNARLADVSREFAPGSKPLEGRVAAFATLRGEGRNVATLKGEGGLSVKEAELYELPQIVKILQMLSVQDPDQTAFNSAYVDFQVFGDRLKLNSVLLEGNSLTLFGDGWLTIREQEKIIDLTLNSRLGNASTQIPLVSDLIGGAGDQLAQIRVEGELSAPIVRQERFPGVKKAWWSVFPEQEPTPTEKIPTAPPRPALDAIRKIFGASNNQE